MRPERQTRVMVTYVHGELSMGSLHACVDLWAVCSEGSKHGKVSSYLARLAAACPCFIPSKTCTFHASGAQSV